MKKSSFQLPKVNEGNLITYFNYAEKTIPSLTRFSDSKIKSAGTHYIN